MLHGGTQGVRRCHGRGLGEAVGAVWAPCGHHSLRTLYQLHICELLYWTIIIMGLFRGALYSLCSLT